MTNVPDAAVVPSVIETFSHSLTDASFWIGLISVVLFAKNRFAISLPEADNLSPPISLRSFTTAFRYHVAAFTYVGMFVAAYFTLIMVGCFPKAQDLLVQWFGQLEIANQKIGTPAWAALAATTLMPSAPGFAGFDRKVRQFFQDFASIPQKASLIGREIVMAISKDGLVQVDKDTALDDVKKAVQSRRGQFKALWRLCEDLKSVEGPPRVARAYEDFFKVAQKVVDTIAGDFKLDLSDMQSDEAVRLLETKLSCGVRRMAKLLACAMLQSEPSEFAINQRLADSKIRIRPISFNFTAQHLVLMFVLIAGMTLVGCYLSLLIYAFVQGDPAGTLAQYKYYFLSMPMLTWPLITVCAYLLPIVLAAGMVMYKLDKRSWDQVPDFTSGFAGGLMVFVGSAGLAFLAVLAYSVYMVAVGYKPIADFQILTLVPWSLPAATVATLFLFMSTRTWCLGKWSGIVVDAIVHGCGAAAASECALFLAGLAGEHYEKMQPDGIMPYLAPISAFVIGASIGAVLCANTRQRVHKVGAAQAGGAAPAGATLALGA
ncbi:MAG TPA: hypothetical protein VMW18_14130 [Candidatus Binatia bacterium]|nr:hypothetical protein [Candidatus Binatia bacterium]